MEVMIELTSVLFAFLDLTPALSYKERGCSLPSQGRARVRSKANSGRPANSDGKIYSILARLSNEKPAVFTLEHDWL